MSVAGRGPYPAHQNPGTQSRRALLTDRTTSGLILQERLGRGGEACWQPGEVLSNPSVDPVAPPTGPKQRSGHERGAESPGRPEAVEPRVAARCSASDPDGASRVRGAAGEGALAPKTVETTTPSPPPQRPPRGAPRGAGRRCAPSGGEPSSGRQGAPAPGLAHQRAGEARRWRASSSSPEPPYVHVLTPVVFIHCRL